MNSDVSKRMARIALAPFAAASSTMRWMTWLRRPSASVLRHALELAAQDDLKPAPICDPTWRERTVSHVPPAAR